MIEVDTKTLRIPLNAAKNALGNLLNSKKDYAMKDVRTQHIVL